MPIYNSKAAKITYIARDIVCSILVELRIILSFRHRSQKFRSKIVRLELCWVHIAALRDTVLRVTHEGRCLLRIRYITDHARDSMSLRTFKFGQLALKVNNVSG